MSPLAWSLLSVVALSLALWGIAGLGDPRRTARVAIWFFNAYTLAVAAVLGFTLWYHIGFERQGSRLLSPAQQTRVSHLGFYVDPDEQFRFVGDDAGNGFHHPALKSGESLVLAHDWQRKDWLLRYDMGSAPLRVNETCINLPAEWWLRPGETFRIELDRSGRTEFVEIGREEGERWWGTPWATFYFSQGTMQSGGPIYGRGARRLVLSRQVLREGLGLAPMVRRAPALRGLAIDEEWWEILRGIAWIREIQSDHRSRLGIMVERGLLATPGLRFSIGSRSLPLPVTRGERRVRAEDRVFYGLGPRGALDLRLAGDTVSDPSWGEILEIRLGRKVSWPLPPDPGTPFLLTSSSEHIPLDGYHVGLGGTSRPFYAKANLGPGLTRVDLTYGRGRRTAALGETIRLGGVDEGILLTVERVEAGASYVGRWAVACVAVQAFLFCLFSWRRGKLAVGLDLAWTLVWNLASTLLVVRLLLAYRVSLLPPEDATPGVLDVFHRALTVSLAVLVAGPLFLLAVRALSLWDLTVWLGRHPRWAALWTRLTAVNRTFLAVAAGGLTLLWILLAKLFGDNESFLDMRINLASHLLVLVVLSLGAAVFLGYRPWGKAMVAGFVLLAGLGVLWTGDRGFVIYGVSLGLALLCLPLWNRRRGPVLWLAGPAFLVLGTLALPYLPALPFAQRIIDPRLPDTVRYRLVSFSDSQDSLLLGSPGKSDVEVDQLLKNSYQAWQMRLYASTGIDLPQGYGRMPLSDRGMTYPTSLADCVFAVYLLSEHGAAAGILLVSLYLLIGLVCLRAVGFLPVPHQHRVLPLVAVAAFFVCNGLYMASANVGVTVFTGQNLPLLALYSKSDALHGLVLLALATLLLRAGVGGTVWQYAPPSRPLKLAQRTFSALAVLWLALLAGGMHQLGADEGFRQNFNFGSRFFAKVESYAKDINTPDERNSPWELVGNELRRKPYGQVTVAEEIFAEQLNQRPNKFDPRGGLFYLERTSRDGRAVTLVRVNRHFFKLRSPLERERLWKGRLIARHEPEHPTISGLGRPFRLTLAEAGPVQSLPLSAPPPLRVSREVLFKENVAETSFEFLELIREDGELFLVPKKGNWQVYVEGQRVDERTKLEEFALIGIAKDLDYQRDFIYLGSQPTVLAYTQWRNGAERRFFPEGRNFPMAYALGKALDRSQSLKIPIPTTLALSIDIELQRALQAEVSSFAGQYPGLYRDDPLRSRAIAVTVLHPTSGEIIAMPAWPAPDPNHPNFEELLEQSSSYQHTRLLTNPNLRRHAIGSTFKPLLFAGLAAQLEPALDLERLIVIHQPRAGQTQLGGLQIDPWDNTEPEERIGARSYLVNSRNAYQVLMGMLGTVLTPEDVQRVLVPSSDPEIEYDGRLFRLDLKRVAQSPFSLQDRLPRPRTETMARTLVFQALSGFYGVGVHGNENDQKLNQCKALLSGLGCNERLVRSNEYLDDVIGEPVNFRPKDFQWIFQDLVIFLIGGGECRWNNVHLAEAWSRVLTGSTVRATLEASPRAPLGVSGARPQWEPLPLPVGDEAWRREHILLPLRDVGSLGTASHLASLAPEMSTFYKTGTIDEGRPGYESELLLFALTGSGGILLDAERTLTGVIYLQDSKTVTGLPRKFDLGERIVKVLAERLENLGGSSASPVAVVSDRAVIMP